MSPSSTEPNTADEYRAAKAGRAYRIRRAAVLDVEGADRAAFLHGQLTQDVLTLPVGRTRPAAGLTPKGKLIFVARLTALPDRLRLLLSADSRARVHEHLKKYAVFQKVSIVDRSDELLRVGLFGSIEGLGGELGQQVQILEGEGEFALELVAPAPERGTIERALHARGLSRVGDEAGEILRVEAGRPRLGQDADESNLADEVGLASAISTTKGCYVGQEIVARTRTYGRVNRRLVGLRFPGGAILSGTVLKLAEEAEPGKIEQGRVTSSVVSPELGPVGLGYAFRDVPAGAILVSAHEPFRPAVVSELPFA